MKNTKRYFLNAWIKILIWSFFITLVTTSRGYSQITRDPCSSITYYISPIYAGNSGVDFDNTTLQLITEEQEDVNFRVLNANQVLIASGVINDSNPFRHEFPFVNNENVIEIYDVNTPTRKGGLIIETEKKITAILENNSYYSRHLITAKGLWGIGTEFFAVSLTRISASDSTERHFLSFMALEDNTQVTVYPPSGLQLVGPSGNTSAPFNVNLNALQSYVVLTAQASPYTISGARVVSDKPITMISGCRHVVMGFGPWRDSGIDQLIPVENLGQEYVLVQTPAIGLLQYGFVVATEDGTQIFEDTNPTPLATINAGQYYEVDKTGVDGTPKRIFTSKPSYVMDVVSPMNGGEVGMALAAPLDQNSGSKSVAFQKTADANSLAIILPDSALSTCMLNGARADTLATLKSNIPGKSNYEVLYIGDANIANGQNVITCSERVHLMHISGVGVSGGRGGYYSNFDPINIYCDYGDLPDSYNTLLISDGPSHQLVFAEYDENAKTSTLMLGSRVDDDELPFPGDLATGDDLNQIDDEESITLAPIDPCPVGKTINVPVNVVNTSGGNATLAGWLDLNQDGAFSASEGQIVNVENGATSKTLTFTLSSCITPPNIAGRFRISSDALTTSSFKGYVSNGEVEDYKFTVLPYTLSINNCPSPITEIGDAGCSTAVPDVTSGITANYSCSGLVNLASVTQTPAAGTTLTGPLTTNIQIVATDDCGIAATCTVALTLNCLDMSFSAVPPDANLGCNPSITPATPGDVMLENSCGTPTITVVENSGTMGCFVNLTNTWTAQDACGTSISTSQVLTYTNDSQAPVFTSVPADENLGYNPTITPATTGDVVVTDNCGIESLTVSSTSTTNGTEITLVNTWTVRDDCGNEEVATQTLTYKVNTTQPQFTTVPADQTGCNLLITPATTGDVTVVDGCGNKTISLSTTQSTNGCEVTIRNVWAARDECDNTVNAEQVIVTTNDTQAPVFTSVPADNDLGYNPTITPATTGDVVVTENCGIKSLTVLSTSTTNGNETTLVNTWTARDDCGNEEVATQTLTYKVNTTLPRFTMVPPDQTGCNLSITPATTGDVTVVDGCGNKTISLSTTQSTNGCEVTIRNTWTASDECDNTVNAEQVIVTTNDTQAPVFTSVPADNDLGYNPTITPATTGDVVVTENCGIESLTVSSTSTTNGTEITLVNTWAARDDCGNEEVATQTLTYKVNTTQPQFTTVPADQTGCNLLITPATTGDVTVVDGCGNKTISLSTTQSTNGCEVTIRNVWTARDECDNTVNAEQVIVTTNDTQAPVFTSVPADNDLGYNPTITPATTGDVVVTENCGIKSLTVLSTSTTNGNETTLVNTWTARDDCGNEEVATQTLTYKVNTTLPRFTMVPPDQTGCNLSITPATTGDVTVVDGCGNKTISLSTTQSTNGCEVTIRNTWTASDECDNTVNAEQVIVTTNDTQAPVFTSVPADNDLGYNPTITPATTGDVVVTENCGIESLTVSSTSTTNGTEITLVNTWAARDDCGNEEVATQTLTYKVNTTQPQFTTVPADQTGCNLLITPATTGDVTVVDGCGNKTISLSTTQSTNGCEVTIRNAWTASDECNNTVSAEQVIITTNDTQAPVFTSVPANKDLGYNPTVTPATTGDVVVTENCGIESLTVSSTSTTNGTEITLVNTWTARDVCGNEQVATQTLTYKVNTTQPQFTTVPADQTGCNLLITPATTGDVTVVDGCGNKTISLSTTQSTNGCEVTIRNVWTARDECDNTVNAEQVIVTTNDTQAPVFTSVPADNDLGYNPTITPATTGDVVVTENCGIKSLTVLSTSTTNGNETTLVNTWTARDDCGNEEVATQTLTYKVNTTLPRFTMVPPDQTGCNLSITPATTGDVTVVDGCGNKTISLSTTQSTNGCEVTIRNTWTASDECDNTVNAEQVIVTTNDTQAPVFTSVPADNDLGYNPTITPATTGDVVVTENCGIESLTVSSTSTTNGTEITLVNTWAARDDCGNEEVATQTLTYKVNTTQPQFTTVPADQTGCNLLITPATTGDVTVVDGCGNKTISLSTTQSTNGCEVTIRNAWTASDECNNTVSAEQVIITTNDTQAPVFTSVPADKDLGYNPTVTPATTGDVVVTENCGIESLTVSSTSTTNGTEITLVNTWTARDVCGNEQVATQTLTYKVNTTQPQFTTVPADQTGCNLLITPATTGDVTVVDGCGNKTISLSTTQSTNGCEVTIRNVWTARDECDNTVNAEQVIITTNDTQAPVFTSVPADENLGYNPTITPATTGDVTVTENCGIESLTVSSTSTTNGIEITLVNTWTARDDCGNEEVATQTLTYKVNTTQPQFTTVPADQAGCNLSITPATTGDVTVVDGCGNKTISLSTIQSTNGCEVTIRNAWTARDECDNTVNAEQVIITTNDTQAPVFTSVPADNDLGYNPTITPATTGDVVVTENCGIESLTVSSTSTTNGTEITLVNTWTARDDCGNEQVATQTLTYKVNTTQPQFTTVPADQTGCNLSITPVTTGDVTVVDGCGNKTISLSTTQSTNGCEVTIRNAWTARDECDNTVNAEQVIITTNDTQAPVFTSVPADKDLGYNPTITPATTGDVMVTENCGIESLTDRKSVV